LAATPNVSELLLPLLAGTLASMLVGLASIYWLLSFLQRRSLLVFGWYRIAAGLLALGVLLLRA
jgi:undecaprenyl pyrophosphate phosphatase UppP